VVVVAVILEVEAAATLPEVAAVVTRLLEAVAAAAVDLTLET